MSRVVAVVAIAVALGVAGFFFFGGLMLYLWFSIGPTPTQQIRRNLVVNAADLQPQFTAPGNWDLCERYSESHYDDGEILYKYRYEADRDTANSQIFGLDGHTNVCPVQQMAINVFETRIRDAERMVALTESTTLRPRPDLLQLGDEQFCAVFVNEFGDLDGMVAVVRAGNTVVSFRMIGHVITDQEQIADLLKTKLDNVAR